MRLAPIHAACLSLLAACSNTGVRAGQYRVYDAPRADEVELTDSIEELAAFDVVFLGEEHDNDVGHRLQLYTIRMLHEQRPEMTISMEQFEVDVQPWLDGYLNGEIDEETFLQHARPWGNYAEHYRPIVEWAREAGVPVVAANIPRPLASRVARSGFRSVAGDELTPWVIELDDPAYMARFVNAMGGHGGMNPATLERFFAAQCLKDETMAESIALATDREEHPLVVHLCGKFHSDQHLGTVSRLARRRPELEIAVVSMSSGDGLARPLTDAERAAGEWLWRVPPMPR